LLSIKTIKTGRWRENCHIIQNSSKSALIIDPGPGCCNEILSLINVGGVKALAILNTHAHFDHIGSVADLKKILKIPFYLHSKDKKLLRSANLYRVLFEEEQHITVPAVDYFFDEITKPLAFDGINVKVIETPGHTKGSVCFQIENCLFTGDTIFEKDIGRVDLPGGDEAELKESLKQLTKLPHNLKLFPGHGNSTTMQHVLANNQKLKGLL
jgi:hydroxyacylglutathione hydrolase